MLHQSVTCFKEEGREVSLWEAERKSEIRPKPVEFLISPVQSSRHQWLDTMQGDSLRLRRHDTQAVAFIMFILGSALGFPQATTRLLLDQTRQAGRSGRRSSSDPGGAAYAYAPRWSEAGRRHATMITFSRGASLRIEDGFRLEMRVGGQGRGRSDGHHQGEETAFVVGSRGRLLEQASATRGGRRSLPMIGRKFRIPHRTGLLMIPPPQASRPEGEGGQGGDGEGYDEEEAEWQAGAGSVLPPGVTPGDIVEGRAEPEWLFGGPGMVGVEYEEALRMAEEAQKAMGMDMDEGGGQGGEEVLWDTGGGGGELRISGEGQGYDVGGVTVSRDDEDDVDDDTVEWDVGNDQLITTEQGEVVRAGDLFPFEEVGAPSLLPSHTYRHERGSGGGSGFGCINTHRRRKTHCNKDTRSHT